MGRHSSDTEEETKSRRKKKHRRRSSSSSSSDRSYSHKKSGRKSRSRSRDVQFRSHSYEKRRRHRSSSSSSYGSKRKRSHSRSRAQGKSYRSQRSRSKSRSRRSHSRPQQRSYSRSSERTSHRRTRSGSREKERRKGRDKEKAREKERSRGKEKEQHYNKSGDAGNIKTGLEHLSAAEQAKARLQLVLEAAAKADEALKAKERSEEEARKKKEDQASLVEQVKRVKEIEAIESDSFIPQTFRSSKEVKKVTESADIKSEPGITEVTNIGVAVTEKEVKPGIIPTTIKYQDENSLCHPNIPPVVPAPVPALRPKQLQIQGQVPSKVLIFLLWWTRPVINRGCLFKEPHRLTITTHASLFGWGAHIQSLTTQGRWSAIEQSCSINWLELQTVQLGLRSFLPQLYIDKAEAEERWFQRLMSLRQERLMGSPVA